MGSEVLLSSIIPFAGSGLLGYAMGFALKKILKWMLIIVGFLAGMFFVGVQLLQRYGYVSAVNWETTLKGVVFRTTTMPGLNGLQLYYKLKAVNRNIKILFVSALDAVPELTSVCLM